MKMVKKVVSFFLIIAIVSTMVGCGDFSSRKDSGLSVVSTIFASYDFAKQIAGENGEVTMLLKPGAEFHSYEPTPKDIITISNCDVFIYVGGENDAWVNDILKSMDTSNMTVIRMLDLVNKYTEEIVEGMDGHEHNDECDHEDNHEGWDEHVWTSPKNAIVICEAIKDTFVKIKPEFADFYEENCKNYVAQLEKLHLDIDTAVKESNKDVLIFGDRFPIRYFVEEYNLRYYAAFPGCSSDTEASAATIAFLIDKVIEEEINVVFKIELSSDSVAKTIADDSDAKVATFNTCHNITSEDFNNGETYVSLMYGNLEALKEALK